MTKEELLNGESENIEFKVQRTEDSSKYMKTVVAFANGKGGTLIFGIDDKTHEVTGIDKESIFREMDAITEAISDSCEPAIIPDIYLQTIDEKSVIVVEIAPGRQLSKEKEELTNLLKKAGSADAERADKAVKALFSGIRSQNRHQAAVQSGSQP